MILQLTIGWPGHPRIVDEQVERKILLFEGNCEIFGGLEGSQVELHILRIELYLWLVPGSLLFHSVYGLQRKHQTYQHRSQAPLPLCSILKVGGRGYSNSRLASSPLTLFWEGQEGDELTENKYSIVKHKVEISNFYIPSSVATPRHTWACAHVKP